MMSNTTDSVRRAVLRLSEGVVAVLFAAVLFGLLFLAGVSTAVIDPRERTYLIQDSIWLNLLAAFIFSLTVYYVGTKSARCRNFAARINSDEAYSSRCRKIALYVIGAVGLLFVLIVQKTPGADQYIICDLANAWMEKDYSSLLPGGWQGYLEMWPRQLGIVLILYFAAYLFGTYNYLVFQICNVLGLVFLLKGFADISDQSGNSRTCGLTVIIAGGLFLPLLAYTSFVYGNILGLALSVNALKYAGRYCDGYRLADGIKSVLLIFAAVLVKNNYLIFLIGLILYVLLMFLKQPTLRRALLGLAMVLVFLVHVDNSFARWATKAVTGQDAGKGMSSLAWVAMGLQGGPRYNGWYNDYSERSYTRNHFDAAAQGRECLDYIRKRMEEFRNDPGMALWFFAGKNASQWNNPEFQGVSLNYRAGRVQRPRWLASLLSVPGIARLTGLLNYYQFLILVGVALFVVLGRRGHGAAFFYCVTFLGGFVFHTFWEAKGQYTMPYFALLLPLCAEGYCTLSQCLSLPGRLGKSEKVRCGLAAALALGFAALVFAYRTPWEHGFLVLEKDTKRYQQYVDAHTYARLPDGRYRLRPCRRPALLLSSKGGIVGDAARVTLSREGDETLYIAFSRSDNVAYIQFESNKKFLDVPNGRGAEGKELHAYTGNRSNAQKWRLHATGEPGKFQVLFGENMALADDAAKSTVHLDKYVWGMSRQSQIWILERVD